MQVLVTGANGFIGKNLCLTLSENPEITILPITHESSYSDLAYAVRSSDWIFHLAGVNRPETENEFIEGNTEFTRRLCNQLIDSGKSTPIVFTSSIQASLDNPYGKSKRSAEDIILKYRQSTGADTFVYRLPNVFGKWCRPNYNSAVATFCYNIARGLPISIDNPDSELNLVYIDDIVQTFIDLFDKNGSSKFLKVQPSYKTTVGDVASQLYAFSQSRKTLITEPVGTGLVRALYATYVSYLPPQAFAYDVPMHTDPRGTFVEMLKTHDSGQFSFFTAHPGATRGDHYHHTKTEKFLVIRGTAMFRFRHVDTKEEFNIEVSGEHSQVVETIPGWTHNITNIGNDEMIVMLWANEIFNRDNPDTIAQKV